MSDGGGQPHTRRRLERTQLYLMGLMCTLTVALGIFIGIVTFAQPVRVDTVIPLVQRFRNFEWFKVVPFAVAPTVLLLVSLALAFINSKIIRVLAFVLLIASIAWLIGVIIADSVILAGRNRAEDPLNPANSYYACCTPEFFTTVTSCPNYGNPTPQCFPPRTRQDIGANGDFVMVYIMEFVFCLSYCLVAVLLLQMDNLLRIINMSSSSSSSDGYKPLMTPGQQPPTNPFVRPGVTRV